MPGSRMSRTLRGASAGALTTLLLALGSCGDDAVLNARDAQPGPVDIRSAAVGATVTTYATVADVLTVEAFVLTGARADGGQLLVAADEAVPVRPGVRVTVSGTVQVFDEAARARLGLEPSERFAAYLGQRFVLARSVDDSVQGEVID
jgi:hypothetical protein